MKKSVYRVLFFFSSRRRHTRWTGDWSSDVCSSDLRVRETVERLGYQPNPAAQGLLRGRSHAVGVVVPDLSNPYFAEVLKGVTAAADEYDRRTLIADTNEDVSQERRVILELARWWTASCCARRGCPTRRCVRRRRPSRT